MIPRKFLIIALLAPLLVGYSQSAFSHSPSSTCNPMGWFPEEFGLKDHTVFYFNDYYYLASINLPGEKKFAYGRTQDFCSWENLGPILDERTMGDWDAAAIWAPFVLEENGVFYMFYAGVTPNITQSIMLATSTNPADPDSWKEHGMIFQPTHEGAVWNDKTWGDCRDPHVIFVDEMYFLYYTGQDETGGIVGVAKATSPYGTWTDLGAVIEPVPGHIFESPVVVSYKDFYYLSYHENIPGQSQGEHSLISESPTGTFREPSPLFPGWAHEIWQDTKDNWYVSYLTNFTVTIAPLSWNEIFQPPRPFIGAQVHNVFLPIAVHGQ
jgi:predicted GH43/DUF377 family glycosyl hydrolase